MIRQLKEFNLSRLHLAGGMAFAAVGHQPRRKPLRSAGEGSNPAKRFPPRPDATMINEAIPLYYIARNGNGLWLTRAADGSTGGLFFLKRSAVGFAHRRSELASCATMILSDRFELDVPNEGGQLAALFDSAMDVVACRAPAVAAIVRAGIAKCRELVAGVVQIKASEQRHRQAIERELFHGQYTLTSKNDDDLPVP